MGNKSKPGEISALTNAHNYWLGRAYLYLESGIYRLVARNINGTVLISKLYHTERGAKIAFSKFFNPRAYKKEGVKSRWSHFYPPEWNRWDESIPEEEVDIVTGTKR